MFQFRNMNSSCPLLNGAHFDKAEAGVFETCMRCSFPKKDKEDSLEAIIFGVRFGNGLYWERAY